VWPEGLCQLKIPMNQTHNLPACSAVPQQTAPPCATVDIAVKNYHHIQIFYQNCISSVNYTHVINYPIK
jgi:hypothetical protein